MPRRVSFTPVPTEGLGLDPATSQAFGSLSEEIRRVVDALDDNMRNIGREIVVNVGPDGRVSLDNLGDRVLRRGDIIMVYGKWRNNVNRPGFHVCDGFAGTPKFHPRPGSVDPQRFPRAVAWGKDAGETGGSETHVHDDHLFSTLIANIASHTINAHTIDNHEHDDGAAGPPKACQCNCDYCLIDVGTSYVAQLCTHEHILDIGDHSHVINNNHGAAVTHAEKVPAGCYEHSTANHVSPYVGVIFLMKM